MAGTRKQFIIKMELQDGKLVAKDAKSISKEMDKIPKGADKAKASLGMLKMAYAAVGVAAVAFAKKAMDAFIKQENAIVRVEASLRAMGQYTPELSQHYQDLAANLQRISRWGDEELLPLMSKLMTLGNVQEDQMERVMRAAMDFSVVVGSMDTAVDLLTKAAVGYTGTLSRYGIILEESIPVNERFEVVLKLIEDRMSGMEQQMTQTTGGAIKQMWNAIGDLTEKGFVPFAPAVTVAAEVITGFAERVGSLVINVETLTDKFSETEETLLRIKRLREGLTGAEMARLAGRDFKGPWEEEAARFAAMLGVAAASLARMKAEAHPDYRLQARPALPGLIPPPEAPMPPGMKVMEGVKDEISECVAEMLRFQDQATEAFGIIGVEIDEFSGRAKVVYKEAAEAVEQFSWRAESAVMMMGNAFSNAFAMMASGAMGAGDAMTKSMLGALGQIARMWGQMLFLAGVGFGSLPGGWLAAQAIPAGLALMALGGTISGLAGGIGRGGGMGGYGGGYGGGYSGSAPGQVSPATQIIIIRGGDGESIDSALNKAGVDRALRNKLYELGRTGDLDFLRS